MLLSKRERPLDNVSPSSTKSSPAAYHRTSIPSITPLTIASIGNSGTSASTRRAPLAPLDPQVAFNTSLDDQMPPSSSSSASSHLGYPIPDSFKDVERAAEAARSFIGRQIVNRSQEEDHSISLQPLRKRSVPSHSNAVRPLPYPRATQRRLSNTPSVPNSRRPSLPGIQYPSSTPHGQAGPSSSLSPPNTASSSESTHMYSAYLTNEDLYSGLSSFTFGAAQPLPSPQGSDTSDMVSPLTMMPEFHSTDRTPRPSIASSNGSRTRQRVAKASDPDEGDDEFDEDEEDATRSKTRSKMRAIDDGNRRPSLPSNAYPPTVTTDNPPPIPAFPMEAVEMSPGGSSGLESGFEDSEADLDEGEPAEFDTDVEFDLQQTHNGSNLDLPVSDTASQHTFGESSLDHYRYVSTSRAGDNDDDDERMSISPVTFSQDDEGHGMNDNASPVSPIDGRRGSLPWDIPGSSRTVTSTGREREDSQATVTVQRARSVDDDAGPTVLIDTVHSTSHPQTRADFRTIEAQSQDIGQVLDEDVQENVPADDVYGELDLDYILGSRKSWSSGRPSYVDGKRRRDSGDPSGLAAEWDNQFVGGRRPSTITVGSDDVFTRQVRDWDVGYEQRKVEWSFQKESADGRGPHRVLSTPPSTLSDINSSTMAPGTQELWRQAYIGRFKVDRVKMASDQPSKAPQQRLNIRHIADPYNKANQRGGPGSVIHKHSRAIAFSIFRNHSLFSRNPKHSKPPMNTSASILLATKKVQEQYTSTRTTAKLNSHGLLEDLRNADGSTVHAQFETIVPPPTSRPATPQEERDSRNDGLMAESSRLTHVKSNAGDARPPHNEASSSTRVSLPPPLPPKDDPPYHQGVPISTGSSSRTELSRITETLRHPLDNTQPSTSSDHSSTLFTHSDRSHSLSREETVDMDDEHSPPRTSHAEAFATVDSSYFEHARGRPESRHTEESGSHGLVGALRRRLLGQGTNKGGPKSQAVAPTVTPREGNYTPPWLTMAPRSKQEERERVIQNLNESFKDVGLLPTRPNKSGPTKKPRRKIQASSNIFEQVPSDSLYMLLPLWPGETDAGSSQLGEDPTSYIVRLEERQYLLVYYVPFDDKSKKKGDVSKKRTRSDARPPAGHSSTNNDRIISLQAFRVCARLVSYSDLRETGVRVPAYGLSITGSMAEAVKYLPSPEIRALRLDDIVIGTCYARRSGMEFVPEGLSKLGLCMPNDIPLPTRPLGEADMAPEEILVLTPLGRAAVEMAWLGCMAVTSFGSV